eukprot:14671429-Alexandrium_andersonii.AAC.1
MGDSDQGVAKVLVLRERKEGDAETALPQQGPTPFRPLVVQAGREPLARIRQRGIFQILWTA